MPADAGVTSALRSPHVGPQRRHTDTARSPRITPRAAHPDEPTGDLDRRISWVHTTELRDPSRYLHGGELVCTVGISLQTTQDCAAFVESLTRAGAAGLCFGIGDVHDTVPGALITSAARDGLPILIAPPNVPFSSVSRYVADFQVGGEISVARATNSLMPELLSSQRRRESVRQLLDRAGEVLGGYLLLDPDEAPEDTGTTTAVDGLGALAWVGSGDPPETAVLQLIARFAQAAQGDRDIESALTRERVGQLLSLIERRMLLPDALNQLLDWAGAELTGTDLLGLAGRGRRRAVDGVSGCPGRRCARGLSGSRGRRPRSQAATELSMPSGHAAAVPLAELGAAITQARIALDLAQQHGGSIGPDQLSTFDSLLEGLP